MYFQIFVAKGDTDQFVWEKQLMNSTIFINKPSSFLEFLVLIFQKYFSEEWE